MQTLPETGVPAPELSSQETVPRPVYTRRTVWRYPFPIGPFGVCGFVPDAFRHIKVETFDKVTRKRLDKRFYYLHRDLFGADRHTWVTGKPSWADSVPYRAQEFRAALADGVRDIWVTEGEKDADALARRAERAVGRGRLLTVLSSSRGSAGLSEGEAAWVRAAAHWYSGLRVTVVADGDPAGAAAALASRQAIGFGRIVRTPLDIAGADLTDHIRAGLRARDLVEIDIRELRAWVGSHAHLLRHGSGRDPNEDAEYAELAHLLAGGWAPVRIGDRAGHE